MKININTNRVAGWAMFASLFVALFVAMIFDGGIAMAAQAFGLTALIVAWVFVAAYLVSEG